MKLLKFYADWCGPCKALSATIDRMGDKIKIPVENINIDENLEMTQTFQVRSVPTMIVLDDNDKEVKRVVGGSLSESQLLTFLEV